MIPKSSKSWLPIIAGVGLVAIITPLGLWFAFGGRPLDDGMIEALHEPARQEHLQREGDWTSVEFAELSDPGGSSAGEGASAANRQALATAWSSRIDDPRGLLSAEMREALLSTLAEHAAARSHASPEPYLKLAEREGDRYRWLRDREEFAANGLITSYEFTFDEPPETLDPEAMLRRLWERWAGEKGHRFRRVGVGADGALVLVRRVRTAYPPDDLRNAAGEAHDGDYWYGPAGADARIFRVPERSLREALQGRASVVHASCHVITETASGALMNWRSDWYWDPDEEAWLCEVMGFTGGRIVYVFF